VCDAAIEGGYDVIVSHHPFIFKGLTAINGEDPVSAKVIKLIANGISVMSFHTRLDAVSGGVNDMLASLLDIRNAEPFGEGDETLGRVGELERPMDIKAFAEKLKSVLRAPTVSYTDSGRPVFRVAVLGGSGSDDIKAALEAGADTYVSGELKYHDMTDSAEMGINLLAAGHFYTENPVCHVLKEVIIGAEENIECDIFFSCNIFTV
jgi:dinuclear metal center YbgI/SA1388 family protein